jgi:hypothetical protein
MTSNNNVEQIAYESVSSIPTLEKNDNYRLGYNVYQALVGKLESIEVAVQSANVRSEMKPTDICNTIREKLKSSGIEIK